MDKILNGTYPPLPSRFGITGLPPPPHCPIQDGPICPTAITPEKRRRLDEQRCTNVQMVVPEGCVQEWNDAIANK